MADTADWPPEKIKEAVYATGISLEALALSAGFSASLCRFSIARAGASSGDRLIARRLGLNPHEIWPSRYHEDGRRRGVPQTKGNVTRRAANRKRQKGAKV